MTSPGTTHHPASPASPGSPASAGSPRTSPRVLVVWCPDWSVVAALGEEGIATTAPAAVLSRNVVEVCNSPARTEGVRRGMRRRDAQSRCPELVLLDAVPDRDARAFEPVLAAVEALRPGVAPLRPGLLAVRAPGRYFGGEEHAAALLAETLVGTGVWDVRVGVADDLFTAEQAARTAGVQEHVVVPAGGSAGFLRRLPVEALLADDEAGPTVSLLQRLGLRTLGDLGDLPGRDVGHRFGRYGTELWRRVRGEEQVLLAARTPSPELACEVVLEPPLDSVEAICFSVRRTCERFVAGLAERQLVATAVRVEAESDEVVGPDGTGVGAGVVVSAREWLHPRYFSARDLVDRVHWQLQGQSQGSVRRRRGTGTARGAGGAAGGVSAPISLVRFVPVGAESAGAYADALWGGGSGELVERGMAKVQALLGYEAVQVPLLQGGRSPAARQATAPWGERPAALRPLDRPWPGAVPGPAPAHLHVPPQPVEVLAAPGRSVLVSDRGALVGTPQRLGLGGAWVPLATWAGPWPVDEGWWEATPGAVAARMQLVAVDGRAWLVGYAEGHWWLEGTYD